MPGEIIIPNGYGMATFTWLNAHLSAPVSVTCGYQNTPQDEPGEIAEEFFEMMVDENRPCDPDLMLADWTFSQVYCFQRDELGNERSAIYSGNVAGEMASSGLTDVPAYSPLVVSKQTFRAGRRYRGRMYPPFTVSNEAAINAGGTIDASALQAEQSRWTNLKNHWIGLTHPPYLLHTDPDGPDNPPLPTAITNLLVRPVVGSQRRRKNR